MRFLILALLLVPTAAALEAQVAFQAPVKVASADYVMLSGTHVAASESPAIVHMEASEVVLERFYDAYALQTAGIIGGGVPLGPTEPTEVGRYTNAHGDLVAHGQSAATAFDIAGRVTTNGNLTLAFFADPGQGFGAVSERSQPKPQSTGLRNLDTAAAAFEYHGASFWTITGDFSVDLFGYAGTLAHEQGEVEMQSGVTHREQTPAMQVEAITYERIHVQNGTLTLSGDLYGSGATPQLDAQVSGSLLIPLVDATNLVIGNETADGTWYIEGEFSLQDVRPAGDQGEASIVGDARLFVVDGVAVEQKWQTPALATVGAVVSLALLWKLLPGATALLTRLPPEKALENENRRKLHEYIVAHPGTTFREVLRGTGIPAGTARHHLTVLGRSKVIVEHGHRSTLRFFENHGKYDQDWEQVVFLREPELNQVYEWLSSNPDAIQKDLLAHADASWGWSRSTTQHRLARLVEGGLVEYRQAGRRKYYRVT